MSWLDTLYPFQSGTSRWQNLLEWAKLPFTQSFSDIRKAVGQTAEDFSGRLGLPVDLGVSELIAGGPTQQTYRQAGATVKTALAPTNPTDTTKTTLNDTGGGGGGGGGGAGGGGGGQGDTGVRTLSPEEIAAQERQSKLNAIAARLQLMRDIARRNIETARGIRDEVVGNIANTFSNLRTSAQNRLNAALENLAQEDLGVLNLYGRAAGTARRAMESALTRNRMLARAMNRLNSSFYDDRQAGVVEGGRQSIADLAQEEAAKRAAIGTRKTETQNWFEQQVNNLEAEEAQLKSQAEREYQAQVNAAADMERAYGIDSLEAAEEAERQYASKLAQIDAYIQDRGARLLEVAAATGKNIGDVLNSFQAINDKLAQALGVNRALTYGQNLSSYLPTFSGVATSDQIANYLPFYQQQGSTRDEIEERLKRIFGYQ